MQQLKGKTAVITGGNSGIGKGIAEHFYREGANVVIFGRNEATLAEAKKEMDNHILTIHGDVTNSADLKNLFEATKKAYGKIDILVANSGVAQRVNVLEATEDNFDYMVDINYRGAYFTVKYALDYLNTPASIILIASCAATMSVKNNSIYGSTKAAVVKLAQHFALDLGERHIRVNAISPGYIKTPLFEGRLKSDPTYLTRREANVPLKRIGTPQDIANVALFLASDAASYITGSNLIVDGGYSINFMEPA